MYPSSAFSEVPSEQPRIESPPTHFAWMVRRVGSGLVLGSIAAFVACGIFEETPLILGVLAAGVAGAFLLWKTNNIEGYVEEIDHFEIDWHKLGKNLSGFGRSIWSFGKRSLHRVYRFVSRLCFSVVIGLGSGLAMLGVAATDQPNDWQIEVLERTGPPIGQAALIMGAVLLITATTWFLLGLRKAEP